MANNVKENRAEQAFKKRKDLLNQPNVEEQSELDKFKKDVDKYFNNVINHFNKKLEQQEVDFNEKIAHLQKKFFDNSNHNIEVFIPTEEFIDDKDYTSTIEDILSIEEIIWKDKNCFNIVVTLKGSSRIYKVFIVERKNLPTKGSKVTFKYNLEHNKLNNFRII
jgi:hypothetical protein